MAIQLSPSATLSLLLLFQHLLAIIALTYCSLPSSAQWSLATLVLLHAHWIRRRSDGRDTELQLLGTELFLRKDGQRLAVELVTATVWHYLMVLRLRARGSNRTRATVYALVLFPDSCSARDWRRLQRLLRHGVIADGAS